MVVIDADGKKLGLYRKSHIPDGPGYQEKFFFRPGDTGFRCFNTAHGAIGVGICWDQWFPEAARAMVLAGADILLYPSGNRFLNLKILAWTLVIPGDALWSDTLLPMHVAWPLQIASARNLVCPFTALLLSATTAATFLPLWTATRGVAIAKLDLKELERERAAFGFFRDRRPDLYQPLTKL